MVSRMQSPLTSYADAAAISVSDTPFIELLNPIEIWVDFSLYIQVFCSCVILFASEMCPEGVNMLIAATMKGQIIGWNLEPCCGFYNEKHFWFILILYIWILKRPQYLKCHSSWSLSSCGLLAVTAAHACEHHCLLSIHNIPHISSLTASHMTQYPRYYYFHLFIICITMWFLYRKPEIDLQLKIELKTSHFMLICLTQCRINRKREIPNRWFYWIEQNNNMIYHHRPGHFTFILQSREWMGFYDAVEISATTGAVKFHSLSKRNII